MTNTGGPMLESTRVSLRRFALTDLDRMIALESDPEVMKFTSMRVPLSVAQSRERLAATIEKEALRAPLGVWAAETKDTREFIGWCMVLDTGAEFPELGFMIVRSQWGKGYASEICKLLCDYAFRSLGCLGLSAVADTENAPSMRVLEKLGFERVRSMTKFDKELRKDVELNVFELKSKPSRS